MKRPSAAARSAAAPSHRPAARPMRIVYTCLVAFAAAGRVPLWAADLEGEAEKMAYSIGYQVGADFRRQGLEVDPDVVVMGVMDALAKVEPAMTDAQMREALHDVQVRANQAAQERRRTLARTNLKAGRKYLQRNA